MKFLVVAVVLVGIATGVGLAALQNRDESSTGVSSGTSGVEDSDPRKDLPIEVLKSLPDDELAEIFPEKAEFILNPELVEQISKDGNKGDNPEYLRAVLEKLGITPPEDATTKELRELLAESESTQTIATK